MRIRLDKEAVLKLYCYCRQAERSVHHALDADWQDFKEYYSPAKTAGMATLAKHLGKLAGPTAAGVRPPTSQEAGKAVPPPGIFRYYLGRWIARRKRSWTFPRVALRYMEATLKAFCNVLDAKSNPEPAQLISLRMDLGACEYLIECRCHGLAEIGWAKRMEHFRMAEWLPSVTLADVLGKSGVDQHSGRRSA